MKWLLYVGGIFLFIFNFYVPMANAESLNKQKKFDWQDAYLYNFYSVCPLQSGHVWVAGSHGMICHYDPKDGEWYIQDSGITENIYQIIFVNEQRGWCVSTNGKILSTKDGGKTWYKQDTPTNKHLFSIIFTDVDNGWAVGCFGTILHTSNGGKDWTRQHKKIDRIYNKVYFVDDQYGWIVGEYGTILHTKNGGETWQKEKSPCGDITLFSVYFKNRKRGWITGMGCRMMTTHDGGKNWQPVTTPIEEEGVNLFDVEVVKKQGWVVGFKGIFFTLNQDKWKDSTNDMPSNSWLHECNFLDQKHGWVVGSAGTVLYTKDGGCSWKSPK